MNRAKTDSTRPAERILAAASELFYQNGYRATGVNEVIARAEVAKATFYSHYPSKEALALRYIEDAAKAELEYVDACIAEAKGPVKRYLAVMASLTAWLVKTEYRGCPFINLASEAPDPASPLRRAGMRVYSEIRGRVALLTRDLVASNAARYGHLDPEHLTQDYMLSFAGAVALAEIYHASWPVDNALEAARRLIGAREPE